MRKLNVISILLPTIFSLMNCDLALALQHGIFGNITAHDDSLSRYADNPFSGQLDFFSADKLTGDFYYLGEFIIEKTEDYEETEMERFYLKYSFSDAIRLSIGQFHSANGYWNQTFHHGRILHDSAERPFFMEFEQAGGASSVLPVHTIGAMLDGFFETDTGLWKYQFQVGTGSTVSIDETDHRTEIKPGSSMSGENLSFNYHLSYQPAEKPYHFGFFVTRNEVKYFGTLANQQTLSRQDHKLSDQLIYGTEAGYHLDKFELLAEYFQFRHFNQPETPGSFDADAFYVQGAYQLTPPLKVIYQYAQLDFEQDDRYFNILNSEQQTHHILTLRYALNQFNTLKLEADQQHLRQAAQDRVYTYRLQWSFLWDNPLRSITR